MLNRRAVGPLTPRLSNVQAKKRGSKAAFFLPGEKPGPESNKPFDTGVLRFVFTFSHNFAFNLSLTRRLQTLDRIFRYFKANFSALIR
jgi:hypothetical protein